MRDSRIIVSPIHTARSLVLLTLALAGCDPSPQSLGDDFPVPEASVRWTTDLGDVADDVLVVDLAEAPDGSIYLLGMANGMGDHDGHRYLDLALAKLDAKGSVVWSQREPVDEPGDEFAAALAIDGAGDVYVAISDEGEASHGGNRLRKLDADGLEQWSQVLPGQPDDIQAVPDGGAIVVGRKDMMAWAQQVDADGNLGWSRSFGDPTRNRNELTTVALTPDDGVILGGVLGAEPAGSIYDTRSWSWLAAVELSDGSERWERRLSDGSSGEQVYQVGVTADGTTLVTRSDHDGVQAFGAEGETLWSAGVDPDAATSWLAVHPDGRFAQGGASFELVPHCTDPDQPCGTTTSHSARIDRFDADRTLRSSLRDECDGTARHLAPAANGDLLAIVDCHDEVEALYRLEP